MFSFPDAKLVESARGASCDESWKEEVEQGSRPSPPDLDISVLGFSFSYKLPVWGAMELTSLSVAE